MISPVILYALAALGGVGVLLTMPRRRFSLAFPGYIVGATAGGLALLALFFAGAGTEEGASATTPNVYFYIFAALGVASGLRVVTHPKPVYSALYFILTILATSGLFLILSAEFMAFALIIIYAGAILITYLFVIMLATQAPNEELVETQPDYDRIAREPVMATVAGFVLLAALTTMLSRGVPTLTMPDSAEAIANRGDEVLAALPKRIEKALREQHMLNESVGMLPSEQLARAIVPEGEYAPYLVDPATRTAVLEVATDAGDGARRTVSWPDDLRLANAEGVGWELIKAHPGAIEIAGVILLMAMLGATILARKQIQIDEDAKRDMALATAGGREEVG